MPDRIAFTVGNDGWVQAVTSALPDHLIYARFQRRGGEVHMPLRCTELYTVGRDGASIDSATLRAVPLRSLTAYVEEETRGDEFGVPNAGNPGPDLETAARHFAMNVHPSQSAGDPRSPTRDWAQQMLLSQRSGSGLPRPFRLLVPPPARSTEEDAQRLGAELKIPTDHHLGREFYVQVADIYRRLCTISPRPAAALAEANAIKPSRVHQWVRRCRELGLLSSTEQGMARG